MHVGSHGRQHLLRRVLAEDDDVIDRSQGCQQAGPLGGRDERPAFALLTAHGSIGVDADDEHVSEPGRLLEARQVTGVEVVEGAVGPDHDPRRGRPALTQGEELGERDDAPGGRQDLVAAVHDHRLERPADRMDDDQVGLLDAGGSIPVGGDRDVDALAERATGIAAEADRRHPGGGGGVDAGQHVGRCPAGAEADGNVVAAPEGVHLAREDPLEAVVVGDRGERERVGRQRDGGDRRPVVLEPADELGGKVLSIGGAAAVAEAEDLAAGPDPARQRERRALDRLRIDAEGTQPPGVGSESISHRCRSSVLPPHGQR